MHSAATQVIPDTDNEIEKEVGDTAHFENKSGMQLGRNSSLLEPFEIQDSELTAALADPASNSNSPPATGRLEMPKFSQIQLSIQRLDSFF